MMIMSKEKKLQRQKIDIEEYKKRQREYVILLRKTIERLKRVNNAMKVLVLSELAILLVVLVR